MGIESRPVFVGDGVSTLRNPVGRLPMFSLWFVDIQTPCDIATLNLILAFIASLILALFPHWTLDNSMFKFLYVGIAKKTKLYYSHASHCKLHIFRHSTRSHVHRLLLVSYLSKSSENQNWLPKTSTVDIAFAQLLIQQWQWLKKVWMHVEFRCSARLGKTASNRYLWREQYGIWS